jgi:hypothetical protein
MRRKRTLLGLALLGTGLAAAGWLGRNQLKARYFVHRLTHAAEADAPGWVDQVEGWGDGVPGGLVDCLAQDDAASCRRAQAALTRLLDQWPDGDPRTPEVLQDLAGRFGRLSAAGGQAALELATAALAHPQPNTLAACRLLVGPGLQHPVADVRLRAVCLAMRPELQHLEPVRPLLADPAAEVRRAAVLALGGAPAIVADDDLLGVLHDPDAEVKRLCRTALRGRGLRERDVEFGRLLVSPKLADRLELLAALHDDGELDLSIWLRRLSQDPAPAVRAAAARAAAEEQVFQMQDRLAQMAAQDPDETVRPIALFHLRQIQTDGVRPAGAVDR